MTEARARQIQEEVAEKHLALNQVFEDIARTHLFFETLQVRNRDSLDFRDASVWGVKSALKAAFEAGRRTMSEFPNDAENDLYLTFNPAQIAVLVYAARHTNGKLVWFPDDLTRTARQRLLDKFADRDLIDDREGEWYLTARACEALGVNPRG